MAKKYKLLLIIIAGLVFLILIGLAFLSRTNNSVSAQEEDYSFLMPVCNQPIPVGDAYETTFDILKETYDKLRDLRYYLISANKEISSLVSTLSENGEDVCDFSKCRAEVTNTAPDIGLDIWPVGFLGLRPAMCSPKECIGQPCPDLEEYLKKEGIEGYKNSVKGIYEVVRDIFNKKTESITEDIKKPGERTGEKIRRPEMARRVLRLARIWLKPMVGEKRSCSMSERDRAKAEADQISVFYPMPCKDALDRGIYWPKATSERCEKECENGPGNECQTCLVNTYNENSSALGKINYKIYHLCKNACSEKEFTKECLDCLCCKEFRRGVCVKTMAEEQCTAFICGGSEHNYVCCEGQPISFEGFEGGISGGGGAGGGY